MSKLTEAEKSRIVEISNALHENQTMLENHRHGDEEPKWNKPLYNRGKEKNES